MMYSNIGSNPISTTKQLINNLKQSNNQNIMKYYSEEKEFIIEKEEILKEIKKCNDSPYYFANKYLIIKNHNNQSIPFTTLLSEEEFNKIFKDYETRRNIKV